ncbi:MAG: FAD-binding oxidoreductase, partial [Anaerolineales bacterium]|nr:FAD-binding oxidoreductase [Anaerolineales bacterium]
MPPSSFSPLVDLKNELLKAQIILHSDLTTRLLYSTDASIYQIEPLGVVFPRSLDELAASVELAASYHIPVLARGSGTSLAGQAIGEALILDCSRYLNHIIEINPETHTAKVEPGVILSSLNNAAGKYNLQFAPDPSSAERATIGGSLANNATGAHSILYGMAADHLQDADVVLADGSLATFKAIPLDEATRRAGNDGYPSRGSQTRTIESNIYRTALHI